MGDNLINIFIYKVSNYLRESKVQAKESVYEMSIENSNILKKAGRILNLFLDKKIDLETPFGDVKSKAFEILDEEKLKKVAKKITKTQKFDETMFQWQYIDKLTKQFQQNLKPIILALNLESTSKEESLMTAYSFIKDSFLKGKSLNTYSNNVFPIDFIPNSMKKYFLNRNQVIVNRYIFYVYMLLRNKLESGDVFCPESTKYRSFEDDLIDNSVWENKDNLMREIGLNKLCEPIGEHLDNLQERLETRTREVNNRISSGENNYFEIKRIGKKTKWLLKYPTEAEEINHRFFSEVKSLDISDIIHYANDKCLFTNVFEHILGRYTKQTKDINALIACLIAWGTNMGLVRMSEISDIDYHKLISVSDNFFRLETLEAANDLICNEISKLLIFELYKIDDIIHSSSDGQKKEVLTSTINARHSPKYFGLNKGVVEYNLVANNIPINSKIIGANEHESHFVYDILYNNTTYIKPEIHSTDTHGANEVNFAMLDFFGYRFAPRYKDIRNVVDEHLYGFQHPYHYDGIIKPVRKINKELIIDEWENIQRIALSLGLKNTTQSVIVRKLSSHQRKNKTKRALWEYDNIIKSLYLLDYIDIEKLRKNVQLALNRGESYHKLKKAISYANFGKLRFKTEQEQQIWSACSRLISNCIIFYNASLLSKILEKNKTADVINLLKRISPVAWQHINLFGKYEFNKEPKHLHIDMVVEELLRNIC
jgi:TnpA family transposase